MLSGVALHGDLALVLDEATCLVQYTLGATLLNGQILNGFFDVVHLVFVLLRNAVLDRFQFHLDLGFEFVLFKCLKGALVLKEEHFNELAACAEPLVENFLRDDGAGVFNQLLQQLLSSGGAVHVVDVFDTSRHIDCKVHPVRPRITHIIRMYPQPWSPTPSITATDALRGNAAEVLSLGREIMIVPPDRPLPT